VRVASVRRGLRHVGRRLGRHSRTLFAATAVLLGLALGGCSGVGGLFAKAPATAYNLSAAKDFPKRARAARGQLIVAEPTALGPHDSEKILVRPTPSEAATLGDAQWEERLPKLMQARLIQSFENASRLRAVGRPADKIATDFVLVSEVRAFEISAAEGAAVVEIAAKIVNERSGRIIAARVIRATVPTPTTQGAGAVEALNEAFVKAATQLVLWAEKVV
jgi:cholesterol transport system auxiliary component